MATAEEQLQLYIKKNEEKVRLAEKNCLRRIYPPVPADLLDDEAYEITQQKPIFKNTERPLPILYYDDGSPVLELFLFNLPVNVKEEELKLIIGNDASNYSIKIRRNLAWIKFTTLQDSLNVQCRARDNNYCIRPKRGHKGELRGFFIRTRPAVRSSSLNLNVETNDNNIFLHMFDIQQDIMENIISHLSFRDILSLMLTSKSVCRSISGMRRNIIITNNYRFPVLPPTSLEFFVRPFGQAQKTSMCRILQLQNETVLQHTLIPTINSIIRSSFKILSVLDLSGITISSKIIREVGENCCKLQKFTIGKTTGDCENDISTFFSRNEESQLTGLKEFGVVNNYHFNGTSLSKLQYTSLEHLSLYKCKKLYVDMIFSFLTNNTNITTLSLLNCNSVGGKELNYLLQNLAATHLRKIIVNIEINDVVNWQFQQNIHINPSESLTDIIYTAGKKVPTNILIILLRNAPNLKRLELSHVNLKSTVQIFNQLSMLEELSLNWVQYNDLGCHHFVSLKLLKIRNVVTSMETVKRVIEKNKSNLTSVDLTQAGKLLEMEELIRLTHLERSWGEKPIEVVLKSTLMKVCMAIKRQLKNTHQPAWPLIRLLYK